LAYIVARPIGTDCVLGCAVVQQLLDTGKFDTMSLEIDQQEHSLELHLPYLYKVFEGHDWKLVHIMAGHVSREQQQQYGQVLAPYVLRMCLVQVTTMTLTT
jgi:MEMO1 family protein